MMKTTGYILTCLIIAAVVLSGTPDTAFAQHSKADRLKVKSTATHAVNPDRIGTGFQDWKASNSVLRTFPELQKEHGITIAQILGYDRAKRSVPDFRLSWDNIFHVPIFLEGKPLQHSRSQFAGSASMHDVTVRTFLRATAGLLRIDAEATSFDLTSAITDENGRSHLRYRQLRNGIPVWGKEIVCGLAPDGDLEVVMGRYVPSDLRIAGSHAISAEDALSTAGSHVLAATGSRLAAESASPVHSHEPTSTRCYLDIDEVLHAAYSIELYTESHERWRVFVDAENREILRAYNSTCYDGPEKASAVDLNSQTRSLDTYLHQGSYYLIDAARPMFNASASTFPDQTKGTITTLSANNSDLQNVTHVTSAGNSWSDASAVSAHANLGVVYDYFRNVHGRNSIDGKGGSVIAVVNVTMGGRPMDNAFWNGQIIAFGNGDQYFTPLAGALDVTAHELTHGVTEHTAGLEYRNQSGALNEAFSDIFGAMVDRDDWTLGEDITRVNNDFPNGTMRDMADPHNGGTQGSAAWQPKHMNEYQDLPESEDNGGVHINSGIINHCAYLLSEQIGRDKAEKIFYNTLATKLTRQAQFIDFRLAIIRSAQELYGATEAQACGTACDQVGITDGSGSVDPEDYPEVNGDDRMLFVNTDPVLPAPLWIAVPPATENDHFSSVSFTPVWSRPSISDDGTVAAFVDTDFNIRAIALDGPPNEQVIDNSGVWNSIALSKDQNLLAVTTVLQNPELFVLDISGAAPVATSFDVYTPNYTGEGIPNTAKFPDAIEFSLDSEYLLFDTYNEVDINGYLHGFWDINLMHVWDTDADAFSTGFIERIFPQEPEVNIGNPTFAKNNPSVIAFDVQYPGDATAYVMGLDMQKGDPVMIAEATYGTNGYPTFRGDDKLLSYVRFMQNMYVVFNIGLAADGITPVGDPQGFIAAANAPLWFRTGERPVAITELPAAAESAVLEQNYPNPFNPSTTIRYSLTEGAQVELTIHDVLGRHIARLRSGMLDAGVYSARWNGRDARGHRVPTGTYYSRLTVDGHVYSKQMLLLK